MTHVAKSPTREIEHGWPTCVDDLLGRQVIALINDSIRSETVLGFAEPLTPDAGEKLVAKIAEAVRNGEKHFFGLFCAGELVGMALLTPNPLPNCRHIVEWSKGVIRSDHQRAGLLRGAVHAMASRCLEKGWDVVTLDVRADTRQQRLWAAIGFKEYGRLEDYARVGGATHAGAFMFASVANLLAATRS